MHSILVTLCIRIRSLTVPCGNDLLLLLVVAGVPLPVSVVWVRWPYIQYAGWVIKQPITVIGSGFPASRRGVRTTGIHRPSIIVVYGGIALNWPIHVRDPEDGRARFCPGCQNRCVGCEVAVVRALRVARNTVFCLVISARVPVERVAGLLTASQR